MGDGRDARFRWAEHTGELELEIEADAEEAVYEAAVRAMSELIEDDEETDAGKRGHARAPVDATVRDIAVEAPDRPRLLAELLGELAFLAETEGFVPEALERLAVDGRRLDATVRGHLGNPPHLVKAVTYHRLAFDADDGRWRASVVLDV